MLRIGTSGWHYGHWMRAFYPEGLRPTGLLAYYARQFDTVEINNTFYRLPRRAVFEDWARQVPAGFVFAVKVSRYITHYSKLTAASVSYARFFDAVGGLGHRLGPLLFQLPPRWSVDSERLASFLAGLPAGFSCAFEFRHPSWYDPAVYRLLERHRAAFCISHLAGHLSPMVVTAPLVYVRLHGPAGAYQGSYADPELGTWAARLDAWHAAGHAVHCYFDNDQKAYAVADALRLREKLGLPPVEP